MDECLCASCTQSIYCDTWSEWKCRAKERRIYNYKAITITNCEYYRKRDKSFKESKCQCENCLENELAMED